VEEVGSVDADGVPCMLYRPTTSWTVGGRVGSRHGGGFAIFEVRGHDRAVRRLADRSGLPVMSIDYRPARGTGLPLRGASAACGGGLWAPARPGRGSAPRDRWFGKES